MFHELFLPPYRRSDKRIFRDSAEFFFSLRDEIFHFHSTCDWIGFEITNIAIYFDDDVGCERTMNEKRTKFD